MPVELMGAVAGYEAQPLPADISANEWDFFHDFILIDELSRVGYIGVLWALIGGNSIGVPPIVNFGTEEQKAKYLPGALRGKIRGCLGITEPDGKLGFIRIPGVFRGLSYQDLSRGKQREATSQISAQQQRCPLTEDPSA